MFREGRGLAELRLVRFQSVSSSFVHRGPKSTSRLSVATEECKKARREGEIRGERRRDRKSRRWSSG